MKHQVNKSIVFQGAIFTPDKEYELTPEQLAGLRQRGALEGDLPEAGSTPGESFPDAFEAVAFIISTREGIERHSDENGEQFILRLIKEGAEARAELDALKSAPVLQPGTLTPPLVALESLGSDVVDSLIAAGYDTLEVIAAASDKDLEALPQIGPATIKKIRELLA